LIREIASIVNTKETLLPFTADHSFDLRIAANGGPHEPLLTGIDKWKQETGGKPPVGLTSLQIEHSHTDEEAQVMANGPGAERVRGYLPNTNIFHIMLQAFGWKEKE